MPPHRLDPKAMIDIVPILRAYPGEFHHLNVVAWLADPKMRDQLEEVLSHHVTACGYTEDSILKAHGLIQLNLLGTELFQFKDAFAPGADNILDVRPHVRLQRPCTDRPKLITTLATLLLEYDRNCAYRDVGRPQVQWYQTQKEFRHLRQTLFRLLRLRRKKRSATDPDLKHFHITTLAEAFATIETVMEAFSPEDYKRLFQDEHKYLDKRGGGFDHRVGHCRPPDMVAEILTPRFCKG